MLLKKLLLFACAIGCILGFSVQGHAVDYRCQKIWAAPSYTKSTRNIGISNLDKIRLASFNVGSLFRGEFDGKVVPNEFSQDVVNRAFTLVENIEASKADVIFLQEVESQEALTFFVESFMSDSFKAFVFPSVEGFGKHIAILMKKTVNLTVEFESHLDQVWKDPTKDFVKEGSESYLFKKDLPLIHFYTSGKSIASYPVFSVFAVHLKSRRDRPLDPLSEVHRRAQVYRMTDLIRKFYEDTGHQTPVFLVGDFNTELNYALPSKVSDHQRHELTPLFDLGYKNSFDLLAKAPASINRFTHITFDRKGRPKHHQLDGFLILEQERTFLMDSGVQEFVDSNGDTIPPSNTIEERGQDPSDHRLIYMDFDIQKILKNRK